MKNPEVGKHENLCVVEFGFVKIALSECAQDMKYETGKLNLRTGTGWGAFFNFLSPLVPRVFLEK